ncbi:hypothetical protein MASR1M36_16040 [Candidatus Cloacimonadaceae bacterium]
MQGLKAVYHSVYSFQMLIGEYSLTGWTKNFIRHSPKNRMLITVLLVQYNKIRYPIVHVFD